MIPNTRIAIITSPVITGRRMNSSDMFIAAPLADPAVP